MGVGETTRRQVIAGLACLPAAAAAGSCVGPLAPRTPDLTAWHRATFVGGLAPYSRRPFLVGPSYVGTSGGGQARFRALMRLGQAPDLVHNKVFGDRVVGGSRADDWDEVQGGPACLGDKGVSPGSQVEFFGTDPMRAAATYPKNVWLSLGIKMMPLGASMDEWRAIARGRHNDSYRRLYARGRHYLASRGWDPALVVDRGEHEANHGTSMSPRFFASGGTLSLWNDMRAQRNRVRAEAWPEIKGMVSLAVEPMIGRLEDWVLPGDRILDLSFHPLRKRLPDAQAAVDLTWQENGRYWSMADALRVARTRGLTISSIENAPRHERPELASVHFPDAYRQHIRFLHENAEHVFGVGLFATAWMDRDRLGGTTELGRAWQQTHDIIRLGLGRAA